MAITATAARKDFYRLIEKVNLDHDEIGITSKSGSAFLVSARDYNALRETAHLLRSPANAARLAASAHRFAKVTQRPVTWLRKTKNRRSAYSRLHRRRLGRLPTLDIERQGDPQASERVDQGSSSRPHIGNR